MNLLLKIKQTNPSLPFSVSPAVLCEAEISSGLEVSGGSLYGA